MASQREVRAARRKRQPSVRGEKGEGISSEACRPLRMSARLQGIQPSLFQKHDGETSVPAGLSPPDKTYKERAIQSHPPSIVQQLSKKHNQKCDQLQEAERCSPPSQDRYSSQQPATPHPSSRIEAAPYAKLTISEKDVDPVELWTWTRKWPRKYFEPTTEASGNSEHEEWLEQAEAMSEPNQEVRYLTINGMQYPLPLRKIAKPYNRKESNFTNNRENKSTPYRDRQYSTLLKRKGSHLENSIRGMTDDSRAWCTRLLKSKQKIPEDSRFGDDVFEETCRKVEGRNESRVIRSINPYLVPSAEDLATSTAIELHRLIETVNEGWTASIPLLGPRPQPDYSVGFRDSAFTEEQFNKLEPLIGGVYDTSFFAANP